MSDVPFYEEETGGRVYVTTSTGWRVECMPVAGALMRVGTASAEPEKPAPPTYKVTDVAGEVETFPHDATSIEDPKTTNEEREAWGAYLIAKSAYEQELAEVEARRNLKKARFMALKGIRLPKQPDLEAWAKEQAEYDIPVANDPTERLVEFISQEVMPTPADGYRVAAGISRASGLSREVLDTVEATFRHTLGWSGGADASADPGAAGESQP